MGYTVQLNLIDPQKHALVMEDRSLSVWSIPLKHRIPTCGYLFAEKPREAHLIREMIDFYQVPVKALRGIKQGENFITPEGVTVPHTRLTRPAQPPRRYAFCSDTAFEPSIVPYIEGVDCLYHEVTFMDSKKSTLPGSPAGKPAGWHWPACWCSKQTLSFLMIPGPVSTPHHANKCAIF